MRGCSFLSGSTAAFMWLFKGYLYSSSSLSCNADCF